MGPDKEIYMDAEKAISDALIKAIRRLPDKASELIHEAAVNESHPSGRLVLDAIEKNIRISRETGLPLCQDTGMFWCLASIGRDSRVPLSRVEDAIINGAGKAAVDGFYRKSIVADPVYSRGNTGTNLPPVIVYESIPGSDIILHFLLKGFGSENCSGVRMLNPTAGEDGVIAAVVDIIREAGGKPCPPEFIGVGIGGTMDRAAVLSKKAFFHPSDKELADRILEKVNELGIGPGGLGGHYTALSVSVIEEPTHIAGLPVAVTVNCWAERMAEIVFKEGEI